MPIECRSPIEAIDFIAAYLETERTPGTEEYTMDENERIRAQNRTIIVKDRKQWDGLSQAAGWLNLLPIPSLSLTPEELNSTVGRGHRVIIAATNFVNHRLQPVSLPRPSRYDLEKALQALGFEREKAAQTARAAGGSLSVLKRHIGMVPDVRVPNWCNERDAVQFLPMLQAGAWDDANEVDRNIISRLAGRPYSDIQAAATRLLQVEDSPLTRIESRWRLVSPEDSWSLVGQQVTDDLLASFKTMAIEGFELGRRVFQPVGRRNVLGLAPLKDRSPEPAIFCGTGWAKR